MEVSPIQIRVQKEQQKIDINKYYHKIKSENNSTKCQIILEALKYYSETVTNGR